MPSIEDLIGAIGGRLGSSLSAASPFQGVANRLGALSPFNPAGVLSGKSPFPNGLAAQSPFQNQALGGESPFAGRGFNVQSPFTGTLVGGTPFGGNPLVSNFNPYAPKPAPQAGQPGYNPYGNQPASGGGYLGSGTASDNTGLTAQRIDQWVAQTRPNSPLAGMGSFILQEANRQGISVPQLMGIMLLESGLGTEQGTLPGVYNYGGLTGTGWEGQTGNTTGMARAFATFSSKEAGVKALIANLASPNYRGKSVQQQIATWYLGDPNAGLNATDENANASLQQYLNTVSQAYQGLGVTFSPQQQPTAAPGGGGQAGTNGVRYNGQSAVQRAQSLIGTPYVLGGLRGHPNDPRQGLDCSEFTGWALGLDQSLWHAQTQYDRSQHLTQQQAQAGDLVFFTATDPNNPNEYVTHVGLYLGNGRFINSQDGGVMEADLNSSYWRAHLAGFGRL